MVAAAALPPMTPAQLEAFLSGPAEHPPPHVKPDLVHPWSMMHSAEISLFILYALSTLVFAIRVFTQLRIARKFYWEDWFLTLSWVVYTGAFIPVGSLLARAPMGVHQWNISFRGFTRYLFLQYTELIIWGIVILFLKITILLQYLRIFVVDGVRNFTFWACHVVLWLNVAYYVAFTFLQMFSCNPREAWWDKMIQPAKCLDIFAINVSGAVICLFSDLSILLLPQRVVVHLNISKRKKFGVCFLFAIGIFACVTSVVRLYYNIDLWQHQTDITYKLGHISFWGTAQIPAGFFIICLPSVPKVINHLRGKPWFLHFETSLRSMLHLPTSKSSHQATGGPKIVTIGGGNKKNVKGTVVSDIEFHDLVNTKHSTSSIASADRISEV